MSQINTFHHTQVSTLATPKSCQSAMKRVYTWPAAKQPLTLRADFGRAPLALAAAGEVPDPVEIDTPAAVAAGAGRSGGGLQFFFFFFCPKNIFFFFFFF
jgi:hypothetical protein